MINLSVKLHIGTMGFSYKDWNGVFYPHEMKARNYLSYYSRVFNSVEIDSSFYGTPGLSTVKRWVYATHPDFLFSLKVPKVITHDLNLVNAGGLMAEFLDRVQILGDRLGVILLQFPPSFDLLHLNNLIDFVRKLPSGFRFAIEIRNQSWYTVEQELADILGEKSIAWASTHYPDLPKKIHITADFVYIRWIGQHGSYRVHNYERRDRSEEIIDWLGMIRTVENQVSNVFGYFNNDFAGFAAGTALRFMKLTGMPVNPVNLPKQTSFL